MVSRPLLGGIPTLSYPNALINRNLRLVLAVVLALLAIAIVAVVLLLTDTLLDVWTRLQTAPAWVFYTYFGVLALFVGGALLLAARVWRSGQARETTTTPSPTAIDETTLYRKIESAERLGLSLSEAAAELEELRRRRDTGEVFVAVFGEISSGKSTLIKALVPDADVQSDVVGGTTKTVSRYTWKSPAQDRLTLVDVPGTAAVGGGFDQRSRDEAIRAHLVIYVCEGDLTRSQLESIRELRTFGKPLLVAVNKSEEYSNDERAQILDRLRTRLNDEETPVVLISAGGREEVVVIDGDGTQRTTLRDRRPNVAALRAGVQTALDQNSDVLDRLRDASVFQLAGEKAVAEEDALRRERADALVTQYTRRAVVGALAAVGPGTDLIIQGVLGTKLVRQMCELYDTPVKTFDLDRLLEIGQSHVGRTTPLILAIAGNGLKSFPGIGTVAGGLVHAVAYGLIFDSLGKALAESLQARKTFSAAPVAATFREKLGEDLETRTRALVRLALAQEENDRR